MSEMLKVGYVGTINAPEFPMPHPLEKLLLKPCEPIHEGSLKVGLLSYKNLLPARFTFAPKDRQPISLQIAGTNQTLRMAHPGKSAFLCLGATNTPEDVSKLTESQYGRPKRPDDYLHLATIAGIEAAGWQVWWTPLPERGNWPHVRIVPNGVLQQHTSSPTNEETQALAQAFKRVV